VTNLGENPHEAFYKGDRAASEYEYKAAIPLHNHSYLVPGILDALGPPRGRSILDLGCGNGTLTSQLAHAGFQTVGADSSGSGIDLARSEFPNLAWCRQDVNEALDLGLRGRFDVVLAADVIEHLFLPRRLFTRATEGLRPSGQLVVTTPFHGYFKNLALALTNKYDFHWRPGWDYGHIKFFSKRTLGEMAIETGFQPVEWKFLGRVPQLAKSMIMVAEKR
jgi:2-polyprenyl-3-methyl-5-hydroxy-6-metoxy-1,4-benzoquinol methylase